jgi:hypothetical protein
MTPKRGQPPKPTEEKRMIQKSVLMNSEEFSEIEKARMKEAPDRRTGAYMRDVAVDHAKEVNRTKMKKKEK